MKAVDFDYLRPASIDELLQRLAGAGGDAKILAGGQTLVPLLAMRLARPTLILDVNRLAELQGIAAESNHIAVQACTRQAALLADATIRRELPLLTKAISFVGHIQTRNRGTIGGSLANADPSAEIGLASLALDAELEVRAAAGARAIAIRDFFIGPMVTALASEECLMTIRFPRRSGGGARGTGFQEVSMRHSDFALAAAAVELVLDGDKICRRLALSVGGAGATPVRLDAAEARLIGTRLEVGDIADAERLVREGVDAVEDLHASAAYRRRISGALAARAIAEAKAEALAGAR